jgi:hypothetical protein
MGTAQWVWGQEVPRRWQLSMRARAAAGKVWSTCAVAALLLAQAAAGVPIGWVVQAAAFQVVT